MSVECIFEKNKVWELIEIENNQQFRLLACLI